jgi:predicted transcriptional regulator YdeE
MHIEQQTQAIRVVGLELRTTNAEALQTIPPHWARVMRDDIFSRIAGKTSDDVYAVYTHFEHAGLDNQGLYSMIIGAPVAADATVPEGLVHAVLPAGWRALFASPDGRPDLVGQTWLEVWARDDLPKAFVADAERYRADGTIELMIGLTHAP